MIRRLPCRLCFIGAMLAAGSMCAQQGSLGSMSMAPAAGNGQTQTFTYTFTDSQGAQNITVVDVLTNNFLNGVNACYIAFANSSSYPTLYLQGNDGSSSQTHALPPGASMIPIGLSNSQCSINTASVSLSGQTLTLNLNITFSGAFASGFGGNAISWLSARNATNGNTGWIAQGVWGAPPIAAPIPEAFSVTPATSSAGSVSYTATIYDSVAAGAADVSVVDLLINNSLNGSNACYAAYDVANHVFYLLQDNGNMPP